MSTEKDQLRRAYCLLAEAFRYFDRPTQDGWEGWRKAEIGGLVKRWLAENKDVCR